MGPKDSEGVSDPCQQRERGDDQEKKSFGKNDDVLAEDFPPRHFLGWPRNWRR